MTNYVAWIAAAQIEGVADTNKHIAPESEGKSGSHVSGPAWRKLPAHNFTARRGSRTEENSVTGNDWQSDPDIWLYRKKTTGLLRRYMRWSLEAGRVPSLLGRELFRSKITAFSATTFEEKVIFLRDVERCLDRLDGFDRQLIARVVLQEYDHESAARLLRCTRKTLERRLPELLDELSESFLNSKLLLRLPETTEQR